MINNERLAEIGRRLTDLGDITSWCGAIDNESGDLLLVLPGQFRYPPLPGQPTGALILENMETSTADDHALMEFLGDAPFAIRDLIAEVERLCAVCDQAIAACEICDEGYLEYSPPGLDAWLPTGDPNIITQPCPYCGPIRTALGREEQTNAL